MKKNEVFFILTVVIFCFVLFLFQLRKETVINNNAAYVIGVVVNKVELESGYLYKCKYFYNDKSYTAEFSDLRRPSDTLIFFKISREYPFTWKYIEFTHVPNCIKMEDVPKLGWSDLPTCDGLE